MRDIHTWNLLAVHIPNPLPRTFIIWDVPWLRKSGRLLWSSVMFFGVCGIAYLMAKRPKRSNEPATWVAAFLGAMVVWAMFALGYGVIPHEWLTFANSYLGFDTTTYVLRQNAVIPFDITRDKLADAVAAGIYGVVLVINVFLFVVWQNRKVAEPAAGTAEGTAPREPGGSPLARLRARREARTSAFGRPVTTSE
jgi:hypothetical protein